MLLAFSYPQYAETRDMQDQHPQAEKSDP